MSTDVSTKFGSTTIGRAAAGRALKFLQNSLVLLASTLPRVASDRLLKACVRLEARVVTSAGARKLPAGSGLQDKSAVMRSMAAKSSA